jgi:hypothetical protein
MRALKLGDLHAGVFQTVVPYFDSRDDVSFGVPAARESR